jgi:hypothetical protein
MVTVLTLFFTSSAFTIIIFLEVLYWLFRVFNATIVLIRTASVV